MARALPHPGNASSEGGPCGVAIDPATDKIYWANFSSGTIRVGEPGRHGYRLDPDRASSEAAPAAWRSTPPQTRSTGPTFISPAAGTIRVAEPGRLGYAPRRCSAARAARAGWRSTPRRTRSTGRTRPRRTNGRSGSRTWTARAPPRPCSASEANPIGLAIDPAANKIYWADLGSCCSGPGPSGRRTSTARVPPRTCSASEAGPAGRGDRPERRTRSTGAISAPARSGLRTWTARVPPRTCSPGRAWRTSPCCCGRRAAPGPRPFPASQGRRGAQLQPGGLGARPARSVPVQGAAQQLRISSG